MEALDSSSRENSPHPASQRTDKPKRRRIDLETIGDQRQRTEEIKGLFAEFIALIERVNEPDPDQKKAMLNADWARDTLQCSPISAEDDAEMFYDILGEDYEVEEVAQMPLAERKRKRIEIGFKLRDPELPSELRI